MIGGELKTYLNMFLKCSPKIALVDYLFERFKGNHVKFKSDVFAYRNGCKFNCGKIMENCKVICDSSDKMKIKMEKGVFIDVGSHIGKHSIPIAKKGFKVIAIEPTKETFKLLKQNIKLNNVPNMFAYNFACARKEGVLEFNYDEMHPATNSLLHKKSKTITVECHPLDIFQDENISAIKIDVEGAELEVLRGATMILNKHHPIIYFECWKPEQAKDIENYLSGFGYNHLEKIDEFNYSIKKDL